jgi:hypothetical protein
MAKERQEDTRRSRPVPAFGLLRHYGMAMSNRDVPARPFAALLFLLALAAGWPGVARGDDADEPQAGAAEAKPADDQPAAEGFAPDDQDAAALGAGSHGPTICARLDELMGKGLSYAERGKTAETRAALHCPPASPATQAAEGTQGGQ